MPAMFGKKVEEYVRFERWILILIVVVFALRLGLSLAGVSKAEYPFITRTGIQTPLPKGTEWVSINLVLLAGILYCAIAVQPRGFGTYKHLFPLLLIQTTIAHWLVGMGNYPGHRNWAQQRFYGGGTLWGVRQGWIKVEPCLGAYCCYTTPGFPRLLASGVRDSFRHSKNPAAGRL